MAFIVPVIRKDYVLYPPVAQHHQQKPHSRTKDPRLTKSLPLIPLSSNIAANNSASILCSSINPRRNSANTEANKTVRHSTPSIRDAPTSLAGSNLSSPQDLDSRINVNSSTGKNTSSHSNTTQSFVRKGTDCELQEISVPIDSGYSSSATPSPSSGSPTTSSSLSAPASPLPSSFMTNSMRPRLRSERILIRRLCDDDDESDEASDTKTGFPEVFLYADASSPSVRHVHFGFCEQIEYERDDVANTSSPTDAMSLNIRGGEASKLGKLKRLEQKLAAQIRNTRCAAFFRPRAHSHPVVSRNRNMTQENTSIDAAEKILETCQKTSNPTENSAQLDIYKINAS